MKKSMGAKTLVHPTPTWVVGTYDEQGKANGATVAWGGVCCSEPPCITISLRKATYSYGNIVKRKAFTVSVPSETHAKEADYFGLASGRDVDKFAASGLTACRGAAAAPSPRRDAKAIAPKPAVDSLKKCRRVACCSC